MALTTKPHLSMTGVLLVWITCQLVVLPASALHFPGSSGSYARYPKWNACTNASISFQFKTTQAEGLLMYTDDQGSYDYLECTHSSGRVRVTMNIVEGRDHPVQLDTGRNVNDGRWHTVEIQRNRMETTLTVDSLTTSRIAFGSDFYFGDLEGNNDVFFGGLPDSYSDNLNSLSFPSSLFQPRFRGSFRNILYGNCSCERTRAKFIEGAGVTLSPPETCTERNPCRNGCICRSEDQGPTCDCSDLKCTSSPHDETHYLLPMDLITGSTIVNPSGLDATAVGDPTLVPGVSGNAIRLHTPEQYIRVSGPSHRQECFGDLDKCPHGYTLAFWVKFENPVDGEEIFLSNGGHTDRSYGVAMIYSNGNLIFRFRRKNGQEWRVQHDDIQPDRWYHVAATWSMTEGLSMYVDGDFVNRDQDSEIRGTVSLHQDKNSFVLGRSGEAQASEGKSRSKRQTHSSMQLDEFSFRSSHQSGHQVRESGAIFKYYLPLERTEGNTLPDSKTSARVYGTPSMIRGKVNRAIRLDGRMEYIDVGEVGDSCLGDLQLCHHGISVSFWLNSFHTQDNMYYMSSGNKGINVYFKDDKLIAEFQQGNKHWKTEWPNFERNKWYFLELSWNPLDGARMYINLIQVAHDENYEMKRPPASTSRFYIGRANTAMSDEKYASAYIDEVEVLYADRSTCMRMGLINRGMPTYHEFPMEDISSSTIPHSEYTISLTGEPILVDGKIGKALSFSGGGQYASLGEHRERCLGNLDYCHQGLLITAWIKFGNVTDGMQFLSTGQNGVKLLCEEGTLYSYFQTSTRLWNVSLADILPDRWYFLELSWHHDKGLKLYNSGHLVSADYEPSKRQVHYDKKRNGVYFARGETLDITGNITFDEVVFYYADRDFLTGFGYLERGRPTHFLFGMDEIEKDRLLHPVLMIQTYGHPTTVQGIANKAVHLNGTRQYLDLGKHGRACLGNLIHCKSGVTGSFWAKFLRFVEKMHYVSTGVYGINVFFRNGTVKVTANVPGKMWLIDLPTLSVDDWNFLEFSWHPRDGLKAYVNNELAGNTSGIQLVADEDMPPISHVYVGRANQGFSENKDFVHGDVVIDELDIWQARREDLIAFDYIRRETVEHVYIPFEKQHDNVIIHPTFAIRVYQGANLVPAKVGNGVSMDGNLQYTTLGEHRNDCFGNLELCNHGLTMKMQLFPRSLGDNQYFMSSGPYQIFYRNGRLYAQFRAGGKLWSCSNSLLRANQWQDLEVTWHEQRGLQMYINGRQVASDSNPTVESPAYNIEDWKVYLGRPNTQIKDGNRANTIIDEMEVWYAHKDFIGLWPKHVKHDIIDMDRIIAGNRVEHKRHEGHNVYALNNPRVIRGWINEAIELDGLNQHINAGPNCSCRGNLQRCYNGYTLRSRIKPNQLQDGMYLFSSAMYDIYYRGGKIWAEFRSPTHRWKVSSSAFSLTDWSLMEWSWHPNKGLHMYVNGKEVAVDTASSVNRGSYNYQKNLYIGRANTDMRIERYGRFTVDDVQLWEAYRDILIDNNLIDPKDETRPGDVRYDIIDMDRIIGRRVQHSKHPEHNVYVYNNPSTVRGWIGNGVKLSGANQYINVGSNASCAGNLDNCRHGFTLRSRVLATNLKEGQYLYSCPMFDIYYRNGKLWARFKTPTKTWTVSTGAYLRDEWNLMEFSWHPTKGLKMYLNKREMAQDRNPVSNNYGYNIADPMYIGRDVLTGNYGQFIVDDVQLWEAWRDYLIEDGLINPDTDPDPPPTAVKKDIIDMDLIRGNQIVHSQHPGHYVYAVHRPTNVQGWINNAVRLNGVNQYINVGANATCRGNLAYCKQGFTLRNRIKPNLVDNSYLYSSSQYDIYYRNGRIHAEFRTPDHIWRVSSGDFNKKEWNLMEWSWHPIHGLIMYVNNREVARSATKLPNTGIYDFNRVMYIGRANTDMQYEKYGQFAVDDVQLWEAWRQYLIDEGLIDPTKDPKPPLGDVYKDIIDMDTIEGNRLLHGSHPGHIIYVRNRPTNVRGWINRAVRLDSSERQYIDVGANATCQGSLQNCRSGFTLRNRIRPNSLQNNMYWFSSAPYDIYYRNGRIHAVFRTPDRVWRVSTTNFNRNNWNLFEYSWHPSQGLIMYVDGVQVARDQSGSRNTDLYSYSQPMYIGRASSQNSHGRFGDFTVDDVQLWQASRDALDDYIPVAPSVEPTEPGFSRPVTTPLPTPSTTTTQEPEYYITFDGTNWILYDMKGLPADQKERSNYEEFMVEFKSTDPNGLIWWAGTEDRNTHLSLKNGQLLLVVEHGGGNTDRFRVSTSRGRLSDGEWHKAIITRNGKNIVISIDGVEADREMSKEPAFITNGAILIGGYQDPRDVTNKNVRRNLNGYIKQMHIRTDRLPQDLDLFDLFHEQPRQYWVIPNGLLPENAKSSPEPVTFRQRGSYLRLPTWDASAEGVIDFKFRTTEPNGLLLYNGGPQGKPDFFSVEMYDGVMYFIIDTGAGVFRYPFAERTVNDGAAHEARVEREGRNLVLYMDKKALQYRVPGSHNEPLDLDTFLYVGAVDLSARLPWHLWTRQEKYFLGCLWDLQLNNGRPVNLPALVRDQAMSGITPGCEEKVATCRHNPCAHGRCYDTWNGAVCDCAGTVYTGDRCQDFANVATFDGTDFLRLHIIPMMQTHTNDISLRFKTKKNNGLLFATDNRINHEFIKALIENGHGKLRTNLGGRAQVIEFGRNLADDQWHTLYIKRRANEMEVWVDDNDHVKAKLPGDGWTLDVDTLHVAAMGDDVDGDGFFAGWMQNFLFDRYNIFGDLPPGWTKEGDPDIGPTGKQIPEHAVTLTHSMDSYATLNTLDTSEDMEVSFMFKTEESDGLLMYNGGGAGNEFFAVELVNGQVFLILNDGGADTHIYKATSARLDDDNWHFVKVRRVGYAFTIVVDELSSSFGRSSSSGGSSRSSSSSSSHSSSSFSGGRHSRQADRLELNGPLYIGGMPRDMYNRLPVAVQSRHGFKGCLASVRISGRLYNLMKDSITRTTYVKENCTATGRFCFTKPCRNGGICLDGIDTFVCDCNLTAYVGRICTDEPEGYYFAKNKRNGVYIYTYDQKWDSKKDALALGFMTWYEDGTIARIDSDSSPDYIEVKLVKGHVVVEYNVGGGVRRIIEDRAKFNDGNYHVVVFHRSGENATVKVDSYPIHRFNPSGSDRVLLFNDILRVKVGANIDNIGNYDNIFRGIIGGVYYNGLRVEDAGILYGSVHSHSNGDVVIANHPFFVHKPDGGGITIPGTPEPVDPGPGVDLPAEVPAENTGGGAIWENTHGGDGLAVIVEPGGGGAGGGSVGAGGIAKPVVSPFVVGGPAEGGRAAAIAGTFIGALLLASSLVYALYKLKPGALPCVGAGGRGGAGAGKGALKISSPRANYQLVDQQVDVANGSAATGTGISMSSFGTQTLEHGAGAGGGAVVMAGGGAGGSQQQTQSFAEYFSSIQQSSGGVGGGGSAGGYGTMTRGIQTDYQTGGESVSVANGYLDQQQLNQQLSHQLNQQQLNQQQQMYNQESFHALDSYQQSSYMQNTLQTDHSGAWQMQNMALTGAQNLATLAAEEIRVDCLLMTSDGRHVVTGSIYGPPQTWDLGSGELVRIMAGEELSSTDLHLACNDTLLVGQVAEMTQVDPADVQAQSRIHNRKLQIWDFLTGRPLEMDRNELCTASCMMSDGERIVLGRTEKFGGGTTIVIYDLLANEAVRTLRYEAAVGFADFISYINLSKDNRYVIAGFQNSYDGNANFIIFDLTADSYSSSVEPKLLALDAVAECTAVLDNHEAVTGTRNGELLIWSMRTGKPLRQLVSATGGTTMTRMGVTKSVAHAKEVKAVCTSNDGKLLVSASADCTIKVWNLESERQLTTLKGHSDEVWCCTISADNDIIVSGSRDNTIRLWRLATASPICVYQTGVDVFSVRMSNNKRTIVALGDKFGARKLIMLRVVVTKTRSRAPSRATSPIHGGSRPTSPLRTTSPLIR